MTPEKQLKLWVEGKPIHNEERNECCPDFSCCQSDLLAPKDIREKFYAGDESTRTEMLGYFLSVACSKASKETGTKVYIAGEKQ